MYARVGFSIPVNSCVYPFPCCIHGCVFLVMCYLEGGDKGIRRTLEYNWGDIFIINL